MALFSNSHFLHHVNSSRSKSLTIPCEWSARVGFSQGYKEKLYCSKNVMCEKLRHRAGNCFCAVKELLGFAEQPHWYRRYSTAKHHENNIQPRNIDHLVVRFTGTEQTTTVLYHLVVNRSYCSVEEYGFLKLFRASMFWGCLSSEQVLDTSDHWRKIWNIKIN